MTEETHLEFTCGEYFIAFSVFLAVLMAHILRRRIVCPEFNWSSINY
jgi:hypothetical protein